MDLVILKSTAEAEIWWNIAYEEDKRQYYKDYNCSEKLILKSRKLVWIQIIYMLYKK
jgi:hypothetical protein